MTSLISPVTRPDSGTRPIDAVDEAGRSAALNAEWLLTNGLGGFAMGTLLGANTRRYHALLIASLSPPVRRVVALHSLIEQLVIGERQIELATHQFGPDLTLHPDGFQRLASLTHHAPDRMAWTWQIADATITRELHLLPNCHAADITYTIRNLTQAALLRIRPMTPLRDFHGLLREGDRVPEVFSRGKTGLLLRHNDIAMMIDAFGPDGSQPSPGWKIEPDWWRSFSYAVDRDRGQDWQEDVWSPGVVELKLAPARDRVITVRVNVAVETPSGTMWMGGHDTKSSSKEPERAAEPSVMSRLRAAAAQFVVARRNAATGGSSTTVIAGYPWFADWGRDTMISLPGLMLTTGRLDEARSTLLTFARAMRNGLLPNLFNDYGGASDYNTVDASLWFVHAVHELWKSGGGKTIDPELLQACHAIVHAYRHGTDYHIGMEPDSLIAAGDSSTQLTWMDAKRDGVSFTPRHGKPVEINALWHHALLCLAAMTDNPRERDDFTQLAARVAASFRSQFWWDEKQCLHDVLTPIATGGGAFVPDGCLRPNQIFAASLPHSPLTADQQKVLVRTVGERLLTPFGLRTLDPEHPMYRGRYEGDLYRRDSSYHQGTVWPWLIGPFCEALLRTEQFSVKSKHEVRRIITPLLHELDAPGRGCLDQIAEVYDGDEPHRPSGCPAQAWSVAEVLRVYSMIEPS